MTALTNLVQDRLTYEILDPKVLQDNLHSISQKLEENKAGYELVLTEAWDYYTSPLLIYTNRQRVTFIADTYIFEGNTSTANVSACIRDTAGSIRF